MLCLPLVSLLLGPSDLSLKVLSLDINLAQSIPISALPHSGAHEHRKNSLLCSLLQVLFGLVELFLQKLDFSRQVLSGGPVGLTLGRSGFELLDLVFGLFNLGLGEG